jgi:mono/diheme cytochrome c family protein
MKRKNLLPVAVFAVFFVIAAFIMQGFTPQTELPSNIPDSVWVVLEKSCYDCHCDDGNGMARGKLNFDKWNGYDEEKQMKKAVAIRDEIEKGKMPPKKYLKKLPDAALSDQEIQRISNWVSVKEQ